MDSYNEFLRADINNMVRRYCSRTGAEFRDGWYKLYAGLERETAFKLSSGTKRKLDAVQKAGLLETLHQIAGQMK